MRIPRIAIVVVNWNGGSFLDRCVASAACQLESGDEMVVVDNGSRDGSPERVERSHPAARILRTGSNLGFAEGCNRGIAATRCEWVFLLNNDATLRPGCIAALRKIAACTDERVGMIQAQMLLAREPGLVNSKGVVMLGNGSARDRDFRKPAREDAGIEEIFCATAGAALYRKRMLDAMRLSTGVFDRTYFMYYEDWDLGWRARLCGWSALYAPQAVVEHALHGSSERQPHRFVLTHLRLNAIRTMLKNATVRRMLLSLPNRLRELIWLLYDNGLSILFEVGVAILDGLRQRREVQALARVPAIEVERRWIGVGSIAVDDEALR